MSKPTPPSDQIASPFRGLDARAMARKIFQGDLSEEAIRAVPPQALYMALQVHGVESSHDLLHVISPRQYLAFLDFEFWRKDQFLEDRFWHWLTAVDEEGTLEPLFQFVKAVDRKLLALMSLLHLRVVVSEEPTDRPPEGEYYTPDQGYTWIEILLEDKAQHRAFARLLAFIFQTNPELFYQLLAAGGGTTSVELEEESFAEKNRRLMDLGIPGFDDAGAANSPIDERMATDLLEKGSQQEFIYDRPVVDPIVYRRSDLEPLGRLVLEIQMASDITLLDNFEREVTFLANAGIVYFGTPPSEGDDVDFLIRKIKGAINVGLEKAGTISRQSPIEIYRNLGVRGMYRLGLGELKRLRLKAERIQASPTKSREEDQEAFTVLEGAAQFPPVLPEFFQDDGSIKSESGLLSTRFKPFEKLEQVLALERFLKERFEN